MAKAKKLIPYAGKAKGDHENFGKQQTGDGLNSFRRARIARLRQAALSPAEIALEVGLPVERVQQAIKEMDL